ncbi:ABC transporter substrate-binding protein [Microbacterium saperdae]
MTRPARRTRLIAIAATLAMTAGLAACAPAGSNDSSQATGEILSVAAPGSSLDGLDPNFSPGAEIDAIRSRQLYDNLTSFDVHNELQYDLATSITSNESGTVWTINLRDGVTFHDGSPFGAKDVAFTIERVTAEDSTANAKSLLTFMPTDGVAIVDELTLTVTLDKPYGPFAELWANTYLPIVPVGFDESKPVGTGPFSFVSFSAGQSSTFARNDAYWGEPAKVDAVKIIDFADDSAAINAVKSGQVDISSSVPLPEVQSLESSGVNILNSPSSLYINLAMNTQVAPFDDARVREALRLVVDRQQIIDSALNGFGVVGNDFIGGTSICVPDLPQRTQDIADAKRLLAASGNEGLQLTLVTTNGAPGMVESAEVFAEQAKAAGIDVDVQNLDVASYLANYLNWPFAVDFFGDTYLQLASRTLLPGGSSVETHWDNEDFQALAEDAFAETDDDARCEIEKQMKEVEYEDGGNIIWGYYNVVNAYSDRVHALEVDITGTAVTRLSSVWLDNGDR